MTLTAIKIERTKPPKTGHIELADGVIGGLRLRVSATGRKAFILSTRVNGQLRRKVIGEFPKMTLAKARTEADRLKGAPAEWIEASPSPRLDRNSFGAAAERYIKREVPGLKRGKETESVIRRELLPEWRDVPIADIRKRDAIRLIDAVLDRGTPSAAFRLHETIKRLFSWALDRDDIEADPMAGLKPPFRKVPRQRVLSDDEIRDVWAAAEDYSYPYGAAVKMLLLTGQRLREVSEMSWAEIDLDAAEWSLPSERTKSAKPHIVPLSQEALAVLHDLPRWNGGDFVFTTRGGARPISGFSKGKALLDDRIDGARKKAGAGPMPAWRLHDLRRTVRTRLAELGVPEIVAEHIMAHGPRDALVRTYNVYAYRDEKAEALERWAVRVRSFITPPPENVVQIHG